MTDDPVVVDVTGGAGGVAASYAAARALADVFDAAGDRLRDWGTAGLRVMRDPDLLESGLLAPAQLCGRRGRGAGRDRRPARCHRRLARLGGRRGGGPLRRRLPGGRPTSPCAPRSPALDRRLAPLEVAATRRPSRPRCTGEDALTEHPGAVAHVVDALGGQVGRPGARPAVRRPGPAGRDAVRRRGAGQPGPAGLGARPGRAPARGGRRSRATPTRPPTAPSRSRRSPGPTGRSGTSSTCRAPTTSHAAVGPGRRRPRPGDRTSQLMSPASTTPTSKASSQALHEAGIRPGEPVLARRALPGRHGGGRDRRPGTTRLRRHRRGHRRLADRAGARASRTARTCSRSSSSATSYPSSTVSPTPTRSSRPRSPSTPIPRAACSPTTTTTAYVEGAGAGRRLDRPVGQRRGAEPARARLPRRDGQTTVTSQVFQITRAR